MVQGLSGLQGVWRCGGGDTTGGVGQGADQWGTCHGDRWV